MQKIGQWLVALTATVASAMMSHEEEKPHITPFISIVGTSLDSTLSLALVCYPAAFPFSPDCCCSIKGKLRLGHAEILSRTRGSCAASTFPPAVRAGLRYCRRRRRLIVRSRCCCLCQRPLRGSGPTDSSRRSQPRPHHPVPWCDEARAIGDVGGGIDHPSSKHPYGNGNQAPGRQQRQQQQQQC
jgi:hypothetical protein